jgi:hypothetical protein
MYSEDPRSRKIVSGAKKAVENSANAKERRIDSSTASAKVMEERERHIVVTARLFPPESNEMAIWRVQLVTILTASSGEGYSDEFLQLLSRQSISLLPPLPARRQVF